jgi:hypothetical protein
MFWQLAFYRQAFFIIAVLCEVVRFLISDTIKNTLYDLKYLDTYSKM